METVAPVAEESLASLMGQPSLQMSVNESESMATLSATHPVQITLFNSLGWSTTQYGLSFSSLYPSN